jgi:hypothetical protein
MREHWAERKIDLEIYQFKAAIRIQQATCGMPAGFAGGRGRNFPLGTEA